MSRLTSLACAVGVLVASAVTLATPAHAAPTSIAVGDSAFSPASVTVSVGDAVTWQFASALPHSVTADDGSFDTGAACSASDTTECRTNGSPDFTMSFPAAGTYDYFCRVHGAVGGTGMSGRIVVVAPDTTAPAVVTGLVATAADRQVTLRWTNPTDADFAAVDVRMATGSVPPASVTDGTGIYSGRATTTTVTGLENGTAYSFSVFSRDTAGNVSAAATRASVSPVPAVGTKMTLAVTPGTVIYGSVVTLTGKLTRLDTGAALAGQPVDIYAKRAGATAWQRINRVTTGTGGTVTYRTSPGSNGHYLLRHPSNPFYALSDSAAVPVQVRPRLSLTMSSTIIEQGKSATISVGITPNHAGQAIYLQRYYGGKWSTIQILRLSSTSTARFVVGPRTLGGYTLRVAKPADADHAAVNSRTLTLSVVRRTLKQGMSGADVLEVQKRLAAMRYDIGAVNGYYSYDTAHAVQAFQKVNGIARTQVVDAATWLRLGRPIAPRLRYSYTNRWVEADLTKQVIYLGRAGALERIVDISSGSGKYYTVEGSTQRAVTPMGNFRVFYKINAWRVSRLGELYRPAYFASGGYAIHGSYSVPPYPASHGCIRVTLGAMDRMFSLLSIGTPVSVYRS